MLLLDKQKNKSLWSYLLDSFLLYIFCISLCRILPWFIIPGVPAVVLTLRYRVLNLILSLLIRVISWNTESQNHRIVWVGMDFRRPPCYGRYIFPQIRLIKAMSKTASWLQSPGRRGVYVFSHKLYLHCRRKTCSKLEVTELIQSN